MGDFQANFHRPEAGIRTVEGNLAGNRAAQLEKKRLHEQEEFELRKKQIIDDRYKQSSNIQNKFAGGGRMTQSETAFQEKTIGLVSIQEFKALQAKAERKNVDDHDGAGGTLQKERTAKEIAEYEKMEKKRKKKKMKEKRKIMSSLSFAHEEEEDDVEEYNIVDDARSNNIHVNECDNDNNKVNAITNIVKPMISSKKDPTVDTSFLPDQQRDRFIEDEKKKYEMEWKIKQVSMKHEKLEIVYSYWDGSGHRRSITCNKGNTIGEFLTLVHESLISEFKELYRIQIPSTDLLYIKEDLILPHDITFYDLIVTKARGKSGPLFHFDVHDDIRLGPIDTRIEKDESHPGKILERSWYERNKHIFPANRWEYYNPQKDYGNYTIS